MRPIEILIGFLPAKDMPNIIQHNVKYATEDDILWDLNGDFSHFGGFKSIEDADADAKSKHYNDYTIRKIYNDDGVIYYSYRVNQDNEFVCGILAPKVPRYGLIQGG